MHTIERLQEILDLGVFNWEHDEQTLRDALRLLQAAQAESLKRYYAKPPAQVQS